MGVDGCRTDRSSAPACPWSSATLPTPTARSFSTPASPTATCSKTATLPRAVFRRSPPRPASSSPSRPGRRGGEQAVRAPDLAASKDSYVYHSVGWAATTGARAAPRTASRASWAAPDTGHALSRQRRRHAVGCHRGMGHAVIPCLGGPAPCPRPSRRGRSPHRRDRGRRNPRSSCPPDLLYAGPRNGRKSRVPAASWHRGPGRSGGIPLDKGDRGDRSTMCGDRCGGSGDGLSWAAWR